MFTYPPPTATQLQHFRGLVGQFKHSRSEAAFLWYFIILGVCAGSFTVGASWRFWKTDHDLRASSILAVAGLALLTLSIIICARRMGIVYCFTNGILTEVSSSGRVRWQESLTTLNTYRVTTSRGFTTLKLKWESHSRTIELVGALEKAMGR